MILDEAREYNRACNIVVTQPRRIAARSIAERVSAERGWELGKLVGYQVRFSLLFDLEIIAFFGGEFGFYKKCSKYFDIIAGFFQDFIGKSKKLSKTSKKISENSKKLSKYFANELRNEQQRVEDCSMRNKTASITSATFL